MAGQWRTSSDLITEALANLGVLAAGDPVDPEDFAYVNEKLDAIFRTLSALEIVNIGDPNNIPGVFFMPLADIVAGECAAKFGSKNEDFIKLKNNGLGGANGVPVGAGTAAIMLKQILRMRPTYETLQVDYL